MTKARLIKRGEVVKQKSKNSQAQNTKSLTKNLTKIVREWVDGRQQSRPAARKAFAALFASAQMKQIA